MTVSRYLVATVFDGLASLPAGSVDLVLMSPPFLALRSYLPADHPDKAREIGGETTPADFLDTLLDIVEACDRVLAPHGSLVVELGDTYSGSTADGGDNRGTAHYPGGRSFIATSRDRSSGWPRDKSLCGIPTLFAWSLAYGRNLLRSERTTEAWRIRNVVAWCRPNPPVGALGDKFRPATSYLTVATKSRTRYFDLDAVRTAVAERPPGGASQGRLGPDGEQRGHITASHPGGAPPLDWWEIPPQPYAGSHFAVWPETLLVRPIESMCPRRVCTVCGEPSRRIVKADRQVTSPQRAATAARSKDPDFGESGRTTYTTLGWSDCGHDSWRPGVVLDPFAGSGTTLAVATGHGRDAIGIDLDERNAELARGRCGMFLVVETVTAAVVA